MISFSRDRRLLDDQRRGQSLEAEQMFMQEAANFVKYSQAACEL